MEGNVSWSGSGAGTGPRIGTLAVGFDRVGDIF